MIGDDTYPRAPTASRAETACTAPVRPTTRSAVGEPSPLAKRAARRAPGLQRSLEATLAPLRKLHSEQLYTIRVAVPDPAAAPLSP